MKGIVWLASYPKSGNTWFRIFLANLLADQPQAVNINDLPTENFGARATFDRALGWETSELSQAEVAEAQLAVQETLAQEDGMVFKVHQSCHHQGTGERLFSPAATRAALYFIRNPLDVVVSFSHHLGRDFDHTIALMNSPAASLAHRADLLDLLLPQPLGTWSWHVQSWLDAAGFPVSVLRYEDMHARPQEVFTAACHFAGFPDEPARVARALAHARFESVRSQELSGGFREARDRRQFFRQGRAGGWREVLSPGQVSAIVQAHGEVMRRFGYLKADGSPV